MRSQATNLHHENLTKAIIYCRVSSVKQTTKGDGLNSQKQDVRNMPKVEAIKSLRYSLMI